MKGTAKKKKLFGGLTAVLATVLAIAIGCTMLCYDWALLVDLALGINSSATVSGTVDEESVYYKSAFGDISALYMAADARTPQQQEALTKMQQELIAAEKAFCERESEEGSVLLRNEQVGGSAALPLAAGSKVTLFGYAAGNPVYRSSSGGAPANVAGRTVSLAQALRDEGFSINETLQSALEGSGADRRVASPTNGNSDIGELEVGFYNNYQNTFSEYGDAAIVMFARTGGEGIDLNTKDIDGVSQLALHKDEQDLLKMIENSGAFDKTVVLINSGYPMELGWLDEAQYGVDACLWIGDPGMYGFAGVADLLSGAANPSGRLSDTYAANSMSAPSMQNFGDISYTNNADYKYIVAAEGIYVGYKYYETRYEDAVLGRGNASASAGSTGGGAWNYANEVVFPFGYGLSYTQFSQTLGEVTYDEATDTFTVPVTVKNIGDVPGKCAVQVYAQTPYDPDVAETEAVRLVGFDKTLGTLTEGGEAETEELTSREAGMLWPGEEEVVEVTVDKYFLTGYSEEACGGEGGYVLTGGDYYLAVGENSHEALNNILAAKGASGMTDENGQPYTADPARVAKLGSWEYDEETYASSPYTGERVQNRLEKQDVNAWQNGAVTYLSRSDWQGTYPQRVTLSLTDEMKKEMDGGTYVAGSDATPRGTYSQGTYAGIDFIQMQGVPFSETYTDENGTQRNADEEWDKFLDQIPVNDLIANTTNGNAALTSISAPRAGHGDGPDGIQGTLDIGQSATCYNSEIVAASTFNPKMLAMRGDFQAEDALFARQTVLWGPGANIHRTPFGGRNFEYYSECGYHGYLCSYYQVKAMREKGLITCIKHFVGNDQETNRTGVATFNNEQAWRETSMKIFEGAIAKGQSLGVMTSFSLIGCTPAPSCRATNIDIMQGEWGFTGINITDSSYQMEYMDSVDCIMNGTTTFCLDNRESDLKKREARSSYDDILGGLRQANKQFYFALLRSNASNGISEGTKLAAGTSWWKIAMLSIDAALGAAAVAAAGAYVYFLVKGTRNKEEEKKNG